MKKNIKVAIYGSNLVISSIAARLSQKPHFQLRQINGTMPESFDQSEEIAPDALLFDLAVTEPDFAGQLLKKHPSILLIGVDLVTHKMLVFSGKQSQLLTDDDLTQVLEGNKPQYDSSIFISEGK